MKLDKIEQEVENNILDYKKVSPKNELKINTIIKNAKEKKSISLRVNSNDLYLLKQKAEQEGIPYQTLISSILHKYSTDQLIDKENILKSIQLLKYSS